MTNHSLRTRGAVQVVLMLAVYVDSALGSTALLAGAARGMAEAVARRVVESERMEIKRIFAG